MRWLLRKIDNLLGSAAAAVVALAASQFLAFVQQYRQRLGGHLDEAQRNLTQIEAGQMLQTLDATARAQAAQEAALRVGYLQQADAALRDSGALLQPVAFLRHFESDIALATFHDFQPAIPVDAASLSYAGIGLLIGWLIYEVARWPVAGLWRGGNDRRRRG